MVVLGLGDSTLGGLLYCVIWLSWKDFIDLQMRNPLQARLPPVSPCHRSPHLANDDTPVTTTHDRVGHNKTKRSTVLNVQQSVGSVRLPPNPVLRPLSPELARRDGPHHTNVRHVVPRRFFIPEMVSCLAGTTVFELEKVVRLEVREFGWLWCTIS